MALKIKFRIPGLVNGYDKDEKEKITPVHTLNIPHRKEFDFPAKGLVSNAVDLFKWNTLLHEGKILDTDDYSKMIKPYPQVSNSIHYSYGLKICQLGKLKEINHNGETHGYLTTVLYYPESELSVIILGNHFPCYTTNADIICQEQNEIREIVRTYLKNHCVTNNDEAPTVTFQFNATRLGPQQDENGRGVSIKAIETASLKTQP